MYRNKNYRMHHNKRIIAKRKNIILNIWNNISFIINPSEYWEKFHVPGKYRKFNLNCGCKMCHFYKRRNNANKYYPKEKEENVRNIMDKEIQKYKYFKN